MSYAYAIKARPTTYDGIEFRSELEAAWAAYFDLTQEMVTESFGRPDFTYEYEPLLNLRNWRPDFQLTFSVPEEDSPEGWECQTRKETILAEVKPYSTIQDWKSDRETLSKIKESLIDLEDCSALLFGVNPTCEATTLYCPMGIRGYSPQLTQPLCGWEEQWDKAKNLVRWKGPNGK